MSNFLHGSETIERTVGARQIPIVKSSVIGLVGTAPKGPVNTPTLVLGENDAAQFGSQIPGFSIPQALEAIFANGAGAVIVVNVFDPETMVDPVSDATYNLVSGRNYFQLLSPLVNAIVIKDHTKTTTYVKDTDYTVSDFGLVTVLSSAMLTENVAGSYKVTYNTIDEAAVTADVIKGEVDAYTEDRTGMKCFDLSYNLFGFNPKLIIAPGYGTLSAVATAMISVAEQFKGFALIDAPESTTVTNALAGRGPNGDINFNTSHKRAVLLYPMLKAYDGYTDDDELRPYSQFFAGLWANVINTEGFHVSPSNHEILGITGVERDLTASIDDENTQTNLLNAAGITTVFSSFGTGYRAWGNRSAAYPSSTATRDVFLPCQMTASVLDESIRWAMLQFLDKPVDQAWIDSVTESVNGFIRNLIQRGALIDGKCIFDTNRNTVEEMSAGHYTFSYSFASPTPGERISFESTYDINLLKNLK